MELRKDLLDGVLLFRMIYPWEFLRYTWGGNEILGQCVSGHSGVKELDLWSLNVFPYNVRCEGLCGKRQVWKREISL